MWDKQLLIEGRYRLERPTRFKQPQAPQLQIYEGAKTDVTLAWLDDTGTPALRATYTGNREQRTQRPTPVTAEEPALQQELTWGWLDVLVSGRLAPEDRLTVGWMGALFRNHIRASSSEAAFRHRLSSEQVYGFWQHDHSSWVQMVYALQAGPVHLAQDDGAEPDVRIREDRYEFKAGVGVVLHEQYRYRFFFNSTWDLDIVDKRQWDGGNVQLQLFF